MDDSIVQITRDLKAVSKDLVFVADKTDIPAYALYRLAHIKEDIDDLFHLMLKNNDAPPSAFERAGVADYVVRGRRVDASTAGTDLEEIPVSEEV